jgi:glycyl-tRNA synthetase beta chain
LQSGKTVSTPDELQLIDTPKGPRLGTHLDSAGRAGAGHPGGARQGTISELPMPKRMRWGASRLEFARPIHWLVLLFGEEHRFADVHGLTPGNRSRGHRFHAPQEVTIPRAEDYEAVLEDARVIADFWRRRDTIRAQVEACAQAAGARAVIDDDLLDEVTSLVEWPVALMGSFDEEFLEVPAEALISSMQSHQKYFPVVDEAGALQPRFITVSNIESREPQAVISGNEKVIRPRLADAAFFYRQDLPGCGKQARGEHPRQGREPGGRPVSE